MRNGRRAPDIHREDRSIAAFGARCSLLGILLPLIASQQPEHEQRSERVAREEGERGGEWRGGLHICYVSPRAGYVHQAWDPRISSRRFAGLMRLKIRPRPGLAGGNASHFSVFFWRWIRFTAGTCIAARARGVCWAAYNCFVGQIHPIAADGIIPLARKRAAWRITGAALTSLGQKNSAPRDRMVAKG